MSLATWGRGNGDGKVILPLVEYDDLDRTANAPVVQPVIGGTEDGTQARERGKEASQTERRDEDIGGESPWDPGPQPHWGSCRRWRVVEPVASYLFERARLEPWMGPGPTPLPDGTLTGGPILDLG